MSNRTRSTTAAILLALALSACGDGRIEPTTAADEVAPATIAINDHHPPSDTGWVPQGADAAERWALARAEAACTTGPVSPDAAEACLAAR